MLFGTRFPRSFRFAITFILSQWHESVRYVSNINSVRYFSRMWIICRKTYDVTWSNTLIAIWYCCGKWYCWKKPIYFCVALNRGVRGHFVSPFSHNRPVSARFSFLIRSPLMYHYNVINGRLTLVSWYIKWSHLWARLTDQIFEDVSPIFPFQRGETWFNIHERME